MVALVYEIIFKRLKNATWCQVCMVTKERSADKIKQKDVEQRTQNMASKPVGIAELDLENGNVTENWKRWKQTMQLMLQGPLAEREENQ